MKVKIKDLLFSELSKSIYSHEPPDDLVRSISENGLLVPIWVSEDNVVISGHRRVRACQKLGIEDIEAEVREYSDTLVIEANRYREKTWQEKLKEAEALEGIYREKGKTQSGSRTDLLLESTKGFTPINTRKEVSKILGVSQDAFYKVKTIAKEKPELLNDIDTGKDSIHAVYRKVKKEIIKAERQEQDEENAKKFDNAVDDVKILCGDFRDVSKLVGKQLYVKEEDFFDTIRLGEKEITDGKQNLDKNIL